MCSTPFGITAFDTSHYDRTIRCRVTGAQRLSASLRSTRHADHHSQRVRLCSTPFGITAFDTSVGSWVGPQVWGRVLNAFRHHCVRHPAFNASTGRVRFRAQRLSASLRSTRWGRSPANCVGCAQRLSASLRSTQRRQGYGPAQAAGAQRLSASLRSTPGGGRTRYTSSGVLNAFRHHCVRHFCLSRALAVSLMCSTPFGITAFDTTGLAARRSSRLRAQRLSASLRSTRQVPVGGLIVLRCSTPFGITAFDTYKGKMFRQDSKLCSTPFGITAFDTNHRRPEQLRPRVLNAFRHHCVRHTATSSATGTGTLCSTPFGITAFDTRPKPKH